MNESGAAKEQIGQYRKVTSELSNFFSDLLLGKFFGQEIALAVYPAQIDSNKFNPQAIQAMASNVILVTRIKTDAEFIEFITKIYNKFKRKATVKSEKYQGYEVATIELNDNVNIVYTKIKDLLVISLGNKAVYSCLDVFAKRKPCIYQDKDYSSTITYLAKPATSLGYVNLETFFSGMRQLAAKNFNRYQKDSSYKTDTLSKLSQLAAFRTLGFSSVADKVVKSKLVMVFDKNKLDPILAKTYSQPSQINSTLSFIPQEVIAYQWMCFDPKTYWDSLAAQMSQAAAAKPAGPSFAEIVAGIEKGLGINLEKELIPALDNEAGVFLHDIDLSGPIPIPKLVIFAKIKNKAVIGNMFNNLIEKNSLQLRSQDYKNSNIKYILSPFGTNLQPAYSIIDNYLLISVNNKIIESCIDAYRDKNKSLLEDADFKSVNFGLSGKNNSILFIKTNLLFDRLKSLGNWVVGWVSLMSANALAAQKETETYLNNAKESLQNKGTELKNLQVKTELLRDEINNLKNQGVSDADKISKLASLEIEVKKREENIEFSRKELGEKEQQFKKSQEEFTKRQKNFSLIKIYLNEVAYPILDGLKIINAIGSATVFKENAIEVNSYSKIAEY